MIPTGARIPVFLVTGFLGAGKTTLINDMLADQRLSNSAVIVNEFGEIGLDHLIIDNGGKPVVELSNGCLCCTVRGQLVDTLLQLTGMGIDRVIIETSGLAEPGPVLLALLAHGQISSIFTVGSVIAVVDTRHALQDLARYPESCMQVAMADSLVLTRRKDLPDRDRQTACLETRLRQINPGAPILFREDLQIPAELLLHKPGLNHVGTDGLVSHSQTGHHQDEVACAILQSTQPVSAAAVDDFCGLTAERFGRDLLRLKGLVLLEESDGPAVIHGVHGIFDHPVSKQHWPHGNRATRLIAIIRNADPGTMHRLFDAIFLNAVSDTPDRQALVANPLAIPGHRLN